jgi:DNA-directed RNA polymerase subunit RPC12/RpoP
VQIPLGVTTMTGTDEQEDDTTFRCENCGGFFPLDEECDTVIGPQCPECEYKFNEEP